MGNNANYTGILTTSSLAGIENLNVTGVTSITTLNNSMMQSVYMTAAGPTSPSVIHPAYFPIIATNAANNVIERTALTKDLELMKINYLNPDFGSDFINSKFVFTT